MKKNYLQSMFGFTLHTNFKLRNFAILLVTLFGLLVPQLVSADGGIQYIGITLQEGSNWNWYQTRVVTWHYGGCQNWAFKDAPSFANKEFGVQTTFRLKKFAVGGWNNKKDDKDNPNTDWIAGKLNYKYWKQGTDVPTNYSDWKVGNFDNYNGEADVKCNSGVDYIIGQEFDIDLIGENPAGKYNLEVISEGQINYKNGSWAHQNGGKMTSTYIIPGFEVTTGTLDFGDISGDIEATDSYVHFGGGLTLEDVAITGTDANEFQKVSISETGVTVRCLASTVGEKTAILTITDEWEKTRVVTLTANVEIPCDAPFTLNSITQSINKCDASNQINAITVASGSIPSNATYAWTPAASVSDAAIYQPNFIGTETEELTLTITNEDAPQCFATATANITYNDNTPTASITTATDKIIQPGAT